MKRVDEIENRKEFLSARGVPSDFINDIALMNLAKEPEVSAGVKFWQFAAYGFWALAAYFYVFGYDLLDNISANNFITNNTSIITRWVPIGLFLTGSILIRISFKKRNQSYSSSLDELEIKKIEQSRVAAYLRTPQLVGKGEYESIAKGTVTPAPAVINTGNIKCADDYLLAIAESDGSFSIRPNS